MRVIARQSSRAAILALLFFCVGAWAMNFSAPRAADTKQDTLTLVTKSGRHKIAIEVAETPAQQSLGLMYRSKLDPAKGMLFAHKHPQEVSMWMRNTYISLDMVFIRADGTVHRIEHRTEPFSDTLISSKGDVSGVLELKGGEATRIGLAPGDKVHYRLFEKP